MSTRLRDERGQVIVLAAVIIPVFLLMTALVLDAGNWFAHNRQLQNRADAAALAAGDELAKRWPACITDPASQSAITAMAKHYGGALESGGVSVDPTAVNTEVVDNSKFDIAVNSTSYDAGTDASDGGGPCFDHAANPAPEGESNISPAGGTWVDVKVKEKDTKSFAGSFGINLSQNRARARVELLQSQQTNDFIPLAIPEQSVQKARIRFINECNDSELASTALKPLKSANQTASGLVLWGPDPSGTATDVDPGTISFSTPTSVPVPGTTTCAGNGQLDFTPVRVELRLAGRKDVDLSNTVSCSDLHSDNTPGNSADCFSDISRIRIYQPAAGLFGDRPQIRDVTFSPSGLNPCNLDPYYSRSSTTTNCTFDASVFIDWGSRPTANATFSATINVAGSPSANLSGPAGGQGTWTATQVPNRTVGPDMVTVNWRYELRSGSWAPGGMNGCTAASPCVKTGTTAVHAVNLGDDPSGNTDPPSDIVGAVKLTDGSDITTSLDRHSAETNATYTAYVTIGLRTVFKTGDWSVLRLDSGGKNFSVICDPWWPTPSTPSAVAQFYFGCQPPYATNDTTVNSFWWNTGTNQCPSAGSYLVAPTGTFPNQRYANTPWKCIELDTGGNGQATGDGIALATGNCTASKVVVDAQPGPGANAQCQSHSYTCYNDAHYFGSGPPPDSSDPRLVKLFVVPWNAYKGIPNGNGTVVPVLRLAGFYITAWQFNGRHDPCADTNPQVAADLARLGTTGDKLAGYFVKEVETSGVGNPTKTCNKDTPDICTVVLTR